MNRSDDPVRGESAKVAKVATGTVTGWLLAVRQGDSIAAQRLWGEYFEQLLRLARGVLEKQTRTTAFDEEDVAASVLGELFIKLQKGGHGDIENRQQLWRLLVVITMRRATELARREKTLKRGGGRVALESEIDAGKRFRLDQLIGADLAATFPEFMSQQCRQLLDSLASADLEQIALWKLAGHTNEEIAAEQGCTRVTIQRKLRLIREIWEAEGGRSDASHWTPLGTV